MSHNVVAHDSSLPVDRITRTLHLYYGRSLSYAGAFAAAEDAVQRLRTAGAKMLCGVCSMNGSVGPTIVRFVLGIVFFAPGAQLMLCWFRGYGPHDSIRFFIAALHIPAALAFLAISAEFFGGLALIAGFAYRLAAIAIGIDMLVALLMVHRQFGFFMNWFGAQRGEGYEYHVLPISIAMFLMIEGAGPLSIDRPLAEH